MTAWGHDRNIVCVLVCGRFGAFSSTVRARARAVVDEVVAPAEQEVLDHGFFPVPRGEIPVAGDVGGHQPPGRALPGAVTLAVADAGMGDHPSGKRSAQVLQRTVVVGGDEDLGGRHHIEEAMRAPPRTESRTNESATVRTQLLLRDRVRSSSMDADHRSPGHVGGCEPVDPCLQRAPRANVAVEDALRVADAGRRPDRPLVRDRHRRPARVRDGRRSGRSRSCRHPFGSRCQRRRAAPTQSRPERDRAGWRRDGPVEGLEVVLPDVVATAEAAGRPIARATTRSWRPAHVPRRVPTARWRRPVG